ncbi:hypothetical protein ACQ4PT_022203 [Festuca glaucescens]
MDTSKTIGSLQLAADVEKAKRPLVTFEPSIWGNYFMDAGPMPCERHVYTDERRDNLIERVSHIIEQCSTDKDLLNGMKNIDAIDRLGIGYHFEREIANFMDILNNTRHEEILNNKQYKDVSFTAVAIRFRLLRQHRFDAPCDLFDDFLNEMGELADKVHHNVDALLSLYEAAFLAKPGEKLLELGGEFARASLSNLLKAGNLSEDILMKVHYALAMPSYRRMKRLDAKLYIPIYEKENAREEEILELAKLDFHALLVMHREEAKYITSWYNELDASSKLTYIRSRPIVCYFWALGVFYEPHYAAARLMFAKIIKLFSLFDDTYDNYGTVEELVQFNEAIQSWDEEAATRVGDNYGYIMALLTKTLREFVVDGVSVVGVDCTKHIIKKVSECMLQEVVWREEGRVPSLYQHLTVTTMTTFYWALACISFAGMSKDEETNKLIFDWVREFPTIIVNACTICRLMDDISGHERERDGNNVATAVACYARDHATTDEDAKEALRLMVEDHWRSITKEFLGNKSIPTSLLVRVINLARVMESMYRKHDGYTQSSRIKDSMDKVLKECILH